MPYNGRRFWLNDLVQDRREGEKFLRVAKIQKKE